MDAQTLKALEHKESQRKELERKRAERKVPDNDVPMAPEIADDKALPNASSVHMLAAIKPETEFGPVRSDLPDDSLNACVLRLRFPS